MKFALPLNVPYHQKTTKLAAGAMAKPLHAGLKEFYRNLLFGVCV